MIPFIVAGLLVNHGQIDLKSSIEAPFRQTDHAIVIDAVVNGKRASFMLDTGFGGWLVLSDQIKVGKPSGTAQLRDFVGRMSASTVELKSLEIGDLKINKPSGEIIQQPLADLTLSYGTHCDGIMGLSPLKDYVTEINFEKNKLIFHPKSFDISKKTPDNQRTFLLKMEPRGFNSIELRSEVNGHPVYMALDTGNAFYITTHKEVLERVGIWDPKQKPKYVFEAWVASGPVDTFYVWIKEAKIFGVPVKNSIWDVIDLPSSSVEDDGTVGFGFLKNFNIIMDFERRYVWLENFSGKVANDPIGEPGIRIGYSDSGRFVVRHVYPGSPADLAGIKKDDIVLAIDGKSLSMVKPKEIRNLIQGTPGSKVKLAISREGLLQRFEVERAILANGSPG